MVPIRYKGFTAEVSQTSDGYTGTFQLDGSTCVFIASTLEQIMPKFVQAVEEGLAYIRTYSSDELEDFVRKHNEQEQELFFITYKPYYGLDYFACLPRKEVLFVFGSLQEGLPFLTEEEVCTLCRQFPIQVKSVYLGEKKVFRAIPWEMVIEVMSKNEHISL